MIAEAVPLPEAVTTSDEAWTTLVAQHEYNRGKKEEFLSVCERVYRKYGDNLPVPRELTITEFAKSGFFSQSFAGDFWRWNVPDPAASGKRLTVRGWWYADGTWIGMSGDYWAGTVRFFRGALCEHQYRALPQRRNCYHERICVKCGHYDAIDSSG